MNLSVLYGMLAYLMEHGKSTALELSNIFEINPRSVYRYVEHLACQGVAIDSKIGRGGGIMLEKNYVLDKALISKDEFNYLKELLKNEKNACAENLKTKLKLF